MARKNRNVPQDTEAERGFVGCRLHGGNDDRLDPMHILDGGRRALSLAIELLQGEGAWNVAKSSHPGDINAAVRANAELVAHAVEKCGTWPGCDDPRSELNLCWDAAPGNVELIGHYVDRLLKAYALRQAIHIHEERLNAAYSGNIDAAVQGTELTAETAAGDWPDPLPLQTELPEVSSFDLNMLPPSFHPWIADVAERIQCPPDYAAVAAMVAPRYGAGSGRDPAGNSAERAIPLCNQQSDRHRPRAVVSKLMAGTSGLSIERLERLAQHLDLEIIVRPCQRRRNSPKGK